MSRSLFALQFGPAAAAAEPSFTTRYWGSRIDAGDRPNAMFPNPITDRIYAANHAEHFAGLQDAADRQQAIEMQKVAAGLPLNVNQAQIARDNAQRMMDWQAGQNQADRDTAFARDALTLELEAMRQPFLSAQADADRANAVNLQGLRNAPAFAQVGLGREQLSSQSDLAREQMATDLERAGIAVGPQYAGLEMQGRIAGGQQGVDMAKIASQEGIAKAALGPENRRNELLSDQLRQQYELGLKALETDLAKQGLANSPELERIRAMQQIEQGRLGLGFAGLESGERVAGIQASPGLAHADVLRQGNQYDYELGQGRLGLGREQLGAENTRFGQELEARLRMAGDENSLRERLAEAAREVEREKLAAMASQFSDSLGFDRDKLAATLGESAADRTAREAMAKMQMGFQGTENAADRQMRQALADQAIGFDREKLTAGLGESEQERALRQQLAEQSLGFDREKMGAMLNDSALGRSHEMSLQGARLSAAEKLSRQGQEFDLRQSDAERAFRSQESDLDRGARMDLMRGETDRSLLLEALQNQRARDVAQIESGARMAAVQQGGMEQAMQAAIAQAQSPDPIMASQGRSALQTLMQQNVATLPMSPEQRETVAPPVNPLVSRMGSLLQTVPAEAGLPEIVDSLRGQAGALSQDPQAISALLDALAARGINLATLPEYTKQLRENPYPGLFGSDHGFQRYDAQPGFFNRLNGVLGLNETVDQYNARRAKLQLLDRLLESQRR